MLYVLTSAQNANTIWNFVWGAGWGRVPYIRPLSYEELFYRQKAPIGHYVFTDFDRMSPYEIQCAATVAAAVQAADPAIRVYNHPLRALERLALLTRLKAAGINDFGATRIDLGGRPPAYPVFIRSEDDCKQPDTGLLHSDAEFDAALIDLAARGIPLKRRIAVEYKAEKHPDGYFRKYGAFKFGEHIILQHVLRNTDWYVKKGQVPRDAAFEAEFTALFDNFTHASELRRVFDIAGIDYGRADYAYVGGRLQVYEINTNPTIPRLRVKRAHNDERYGRLGPALLAGFKDMNPPHRNGPPVHFDLPEPQFQRFQPLDWRTQGYLLKLKAQGFGSRLLPPSIPGLVATR